MEKPQQKDPDAVTAPQEEMKKASVVPLAAPYRPFEHLPLADESTPATPFDPVPGRHRGF